MMGDSEKPAGTHIPLMGSKTLSLSMSILAAIQSMSPNRSKLSARAGGSAYTY